MSIYKSCKSIVLVNTKILDPDSMQCSGASKPFQPSDKVDHISCIMTKAKIYAIYSDIK